MCCCLVTKSQLFCNSTDCSPPSFSVHEIFQARILELVVISFSRGSFLPSDWTHVSCIGRHWEAYSLPLSHTGNEVCSICCCSVAQSCPTLCNLMDCSTSGFPVFQYLSELAQTHVHWVSDAIQPSHPLLSPSPPALNLSQHQDLFQWVSSLHQVAKVLEFQLQHQSFQ